MVEEVEQTLEFAPRNVWEANGRAVGLACAVDEVALEEVLEVRRVALKEVSVHAEQGVLNLCLLGQLTIHSMLHGEELTRMMTISSSM